jgi:hypothetical protein
MGYDIDFGSSLLPPGKANLNIPVEYSPRPFYAGRKKKGTEQSI